MRKFPKFPDTLRVVITAAEAQRGVDYRLDGNTPWTPLNRALVMAAPITGCGVEVTATEAIIRTGSGDYRYALGPQGSAIAAAIEAGGEIGPCTLELQRIQKKGK